MQPGNLQNWRSPLLLNPEVWVFRIGEKVGVQFLSDRARKIAEQCTDGEISVPLDTTVWIDEDVVNHLLNFMPDDMEIVMDHEGGNA